jgi:hypothetical protein
MEREARRLIGPGVYGCTGSIEPRTVPYNRTYGPYQSRTVYEPCKPYIANRGFA